MAGNHFSLADQNKLRDWTFHEFAETLGDLEDSLMLADLQTTFEILTNAIETFIWALSNFISQFLRSI